MKTPLQVTLPCRQTPAVTGEIYCLSPSSPAYSFLNRLKNITMYIFGYGIRRESKQLLPINIITASIPHILLNAHPLAASVICSSHQTCATHTAHPAETSPGHPLMHLKDISINHVYHKSAGLCTSRAGEIKITLRRQL